MERPGPWGSSARVVTKLAPWSVERATRMPPPGEPPEAASQATYTLSRLGLAGFWSTVIIGLSLKWLFPPSKENSVGPAQVRPPSADRATAISVPLIDLNWELKNTTMNE